MLLVPWLFNWHDFDKPLPKNAAYDALAGRRSLQRVSAPDFALLDLTTLTMTVLG